MTRGFVMFGVAWLPVVFLIKKSMKTICKLPGYLMLAFLMAWVAPTARGVVVYSNTDTFVAQFNPGTVEVGDEITLGGTDRFITAFSFEYFGANFGGSEMAKVRFYKNNGRPSTAGPPMPSEIMYDSGTFPIGATPAATLNFNQADLNGGILVPNNFTWSVTFSGLGGSALAGVNLYNPPLIGSSFSDYWQNDGDVWGLQTNANFSINFGSQFEASAVPEPSTVAGLSVATGLFLMLRVINRRSGGSLTRWITNVCR